MARKGKKSLKRILSEKGLLILWITFMIVWNVFATYGVASWNGKLMDSQVEFVACNENEFPSVNVSFGDVQKNGSIFLGEVYDDLRYSFKSHADLVIWNNGTNDLMVMDPNETGSNVWAHSIMWVSKYSVQDLIDKNYMEWEISLDANSLSHFYILNCEFSSGMVDLTESDTIWEWSGTNISNKSVTLDALDLLESKTENGNGRVVFVLSRHANDDGVPYSTGEIIEFKFERFDPSDSFYLSKMFIWKAFAVISSIANFYMFLVCSGLHNPISKDGRIDKFLAKRKMKKTVKRRRY